jgi:hypothetical protein
MYGCTARFCFLSQRTFLFSQIFFLRDNLVTSSEYNSKQSRATICEVSRLTQASTNAESPKISQNGLEIWMFELRTVFQRQAKDGRTDPLSLLDWPL